MSTSRSDRKDGVRLTMHQKRFSSRATPNHQGGIFSRERPPVSLMGWRHWLNKHDFLLVIRGNLVVMFYRCRSVSKNASEMVVGKHSPAVELVSYCDESIKALVRVSELVGRHVVSLAPVRSTARLQHQFLHRGEQLFTRNRLAVRAAAHQTQPTPASNNYARPA